ncbi:toll/interleukin-1 receptor domain-containing protein [Chloroflexota bacterium]
MLKLFISYAHKDGADAAARLHDQLEQFGFDVWQDVNDMRGGITWKEQLRDILRDCDIVLVLLTSGAVASEVVTWEWENALTLQKRVIPLLIETCGLPPELARLHYHDFRPYVQFEKAFGKLVSDLGATLRQKYQPAQPEPTPSSGSKYNIQGNIDTSYIGDNGVLINNPVYNAPDLAWQARIDAALAALRRGQTAIRSDIRTTHQVQLEQIQAAIQQGRIEQGEIAATTDAIRRALRAMQTASDQMDAQTRRALADLSATLQNTAGVEHKLELTLPIIPALLTYKQEWAVGGQVDLDSAMQALQERWEALLRRAK